MTKGLKDAQITDGLPRVLAEQPWVRALSLAMLELHRKTMDYIDASQVYTAIDTVTEEVLDALAVNWKIDWYDTGYGIEQKRRIVKTALNIRRTMGTAGAARTQADAIYPGTKLEEWFEYGGTHGKFRLRVNITTVEERQKFAAMTGAEIERRLAAAKRFSAHLEEVEYYDAGGTATAYGIASLPVIPQSTVIIRVARRWLTSATHRNSKSGGNEKWHGKALSPTAAVSCWHNGRRERR